jgi:methyltransferase (TIGR00027 family)
MDDVEASRTAVIVCQGRAAAHGTRAHERFSDPTAARFLSPAEMAPVDRFLDGSPPGEWRDRMVYESIRASAELMVPRTIAIDDAIREWSNPQLVVVGAGLDGRAWRMPELATVEVFEVDHPASQRDKVARVGGTRPMARHVHFVPVDFKRDSLPAALEAAGHLDSLSTTWVWEGVVPYLSGAEVKATMRAIAKRSAPGSRLIVNYQAPSVSAVLGRRVARTMMLLSRRPDPWEHEPRRSSWRPARMQALLVECGFTMVSDDDLLTLAERLAVTVRGTRSHRSGRVAVADR